MSYTSGMRWHEISQDMALGSMTQFSAVHLAVHLAHPARRCALQEWGAPGAPLREPCLSSEYADSGLGELVGDSQRTKLTNSKIAELTSCKTICQLHVLHVLHVNVFANCKVRSSVCCSCSRTEVPKRPFKQNCWLGFQVDHWILFK